MKKLLFLFLAVLCLLLVACSTTTEESSPEPTTAEHELFEPYTDEDGNLVVDVSDYEFPDEIFEPK